MRYYACESTPWAKVVRARLVSSWYQAAEGVGGDGGRDDGSVSRDSERRGERERLMKSSLTNSSTQNRVGRGFPPVASWQRLIHRGPEVAGNYGG